MHVQISLKENVCMKMCFFFSFFFNVCTNVYFLKKNVCTKCFFFFLEKNVCTNIFFKIFQY